MIPNNSTYEAGFKTQFFTIVLMSSILIFGAWTLTNFIINISKNEENQKKINKLYQKGLDYLNYLFEDLKYIENAIKFFQKNFRHKQVYESVARENGLLPPYIEEKPKTIYCAEYYQKVIEKQKSAKELYSDVTIYLTLSNGMTLNYIPKYPWYWDGVELFTGIQPNSKKIYNPEYLSPDYVPMFNIFDDNNNNNNFFLGYKTQDVKAEQEAIEHNINNTNSSSEDEKKLSTLLLTKNNSLNTNTSSFSPVLLTINENNCEETKNQETIHVEIDTNHNIDIPVEKENKDLFVSVPSEYSIENFKENESKNNLKLSNSPSQIQANNETKIKHYIRPTKSTTNLNKEKMSSIKENSSSSPLRKSKSLPSLKNKDKDQQKQKYIKKLKHKKQPKIIYPSIPVNPDLSFVPLYKKNFNDSKLISKVKHSDMENTYKRLNCNKNL
ncbi:hypothetical protein H8356DRAFT_1270798 [Neocallimastix lanati (nom. inval.)]|jgi:hypothetical protein|uniref:Uncharacterized protein n=1 Tax=Neocallimastix californiae TaxID=1754190 RepID=A0A1Y2FVU1_9FUNG|nr:hypothetical protein H8356DRAFT_1270798 [Neocallimastix sp. JGI-2020a]ORY87306.1 hypothetical protein LY90DRAFT_663023 [Neocallimastix californiae]|eukprot:ORY87306.1 hypothetical protein LY90DRAFT_663023 [Neocallimastix californiae]